MEPRAALVIASQDTAPPVVLALASQSWHLEVVHTGRRAMQLAGRVRPHVVVLEPALLGDLAAVVVRRLQLRWGRRLPIVGIAPSRPSDFMIGELSLSEIMLPPLEAATVLSAANQALRAGWADGRARLSSIEDLARLWRGGRLGMGHAAQLAGHPPPGSHEVASGVWDALPVYRDLVVPLHALAGSD